jgi:excisionase family DNA binding protein
MPVVFEDELLTVQELTQLLKVNRRTVYRLLESGDLPFAIKIKGNWRFQLSDVTAWLSKSKQFSQGAALTG